MKIALLVCLLMSPLAGAVELDFANAKAQADRDEAALDPATAAALAQAHAALAGPVLAKCGADKPKADHAPFVLVMELNARGRIVRTWLRGESKVARCFHKRMRDRLLPAPTKTPFLTSFAMTFKG